ncbi:MAG: hypothetical protein ACRC5C_06045 [Bacilli bacterium]
MAKIKMGDIFAIDVENKKAYMQFIMVDKDGLELVRILSGLHSGDNEDIESIVNLKERYFIFFPLKAAKRKKIVTYITNFNVPEHVVIPKAFRSNTRDKEGNVTWYIVNPEPLRWNRVEALTEEHMKLSQWGIWNDTLLIERLKENWSLEMWC